MKLTYYVSYIFLFLILTISCKTHMEPEIFLIPKGYRGKINIIFNQSQGDSVKYEKSSRIYEIPKSGILLTQFKDQVGSVNYKYYYVDSIGKRQELKIIQEMNETKAEDASVFRSGTIGVYGDSSSGNSLTYQQFYIADSRDFESYFSQEYEKEFKNKIINLVGYSW